MQYYDKIGLLRAAGRTEAGYRLYDDAALERLQQILLFRELEFPLKDIQKIVENPAFDRQKALEQQITLLTLKKQHLEDLIGLAQKIRSTGGMVMDFTAFDTQKIKKYTEQAKKEWGETPEYKELIATMRNTVQIADRLMKEVRPSLLNERYFTTEQVMDLFHISRRALQNYRDKGIIPFVSVGGNILYPETKIRDMLEKNYYKL